MKLIQSVEPIEYCVPLSDMKEYLRVLHDDDDALISAMIIQASQSAEMITNRQLIPATYELYFDAMPTAFVLPRPPFISVDSFQVHDGDVFNDVTEYELDDKSTPSVVYPVSWPKVSDKKNSVRITYRAGYKDVSKVPEGIKSWIKIQVASYYEHRESFVVGTIVSELPSSHVQGLLMKYRIHNV